MTVCAHKGSEALAHRDRKAASLVAGVASACAVVPSQWLRLARWLAWWRTTPPSSWALGTPPRHEPLVASAVSGQCKPRPCTEHLLATVGTQPQGHPAVARMAPRAADVTAVLRRWLSVARHALPELCGDRWCAAAPGAIIAQGAVGLINSVGPTRCWSYVGFALASCRAHWLVDGLMLSLSRKFHPMKRCCLSWPASRDRLRAIALVPRERDCDRPPRRSSTGHLPRWPSLTAPGVEQI